MTTATATRSQTDVASQVEEAYSELDCCSTQTQIPHGGDIAAFACRHDKCPVAAGWLCKAHYDYYVAVIYPKNEHTREWIGCYRCPTCKQKFNTLNEYGKVIPI